MLVSYSKLATANSVTVSASTPTSTIASTGTSDRVRYSKLATANSVLISQGPLAHGVSGAKTKEKERGSLLTAAGRLADHVAPALLLQVALLLADQDQHIMSGPPRLQVAHGRK